MAVKVMISYDIADNNRRAKAAALLQSYGNRIEESVYYLSVADKHFEHICKRLDELLDKDEDISHIVNLCQSCAKQVAVIGPADCSGNELYTGLW